MFESTGMLRSRISYSHEVALISLYLYTILPRITDIDGVVYNYGN
jgi:hypothetical protein